MVRSPLKCSLQACFGLVISCPLQVLQINILNGLHVPRGGGEPRGCRKSRGYKSTGLNWHNQGPLLFNHAPVGHCKKKKMHMQILCHQHQLQAWFNLKPDTSIYCFPSPEAFLLLLICLSLCVTLNLHLVSLLPPCSSRGTILWMAESARDSLGACYWHIVASSLVNSSRCRRAWRRCLRMHR